MTREHLFFYLCDSAPESYWAKSGILFEPLQGFDSHFSVFSPSFVNEKFLIVAGTLARVDFRHMASELDPTSESFTTVPTNALLSSWRDPDL